MQVLLLSIDDLLITSVIYTSSKLRVPLVHIGLMIAIELQPPWFPRWDLRSCDPDVKCALLQFQNEFHASVNVHLCRWQLAI